jgi:hypothetical protein
MLVLLFIVVALILCVLLFGARAVRLILAIPVLLIGGFGLYIVDKYNGGSGWGWLRIFWIPALIVGVPLALVIAWMLGSVLRHRKRCPFCRKWLVETATYCHECQTELPREMNSPSPTS